MESTPYNVLGVRHTIHVFLIRRVPECASVIARLSHPGLQQNICFKNLKTLNPELNQENHRKLLISKRKVYVKV